MGKKEEASEYLASKEFTKQRKEIVANTVKDYKSSDEFYNMRAGVMSYVREQHVRIHTHIPSLNLDFFYDPPTDDEASPGRDEGGDDSGDAQGVEGGEGNRGNTA